MFTLLIKLLFVFTVPKTGLATCQEDDGGKYWMMTNGYQNLPVNPADYQKTTRPNEKIRDNVSRRMNSEKTDQKSGKSEKGNQNFENIVNYGNQNPNIITNPNYEMNYGIKSNYEMNPNYEMNTNYGMNPNYVMNPNFVINSNLAKYPNSEAGVSPNLFRNDDMYPKFAMHPNFGKAPQFLNHDVPKSTNQDYPSYEDFEDPNFLIMNSDFASRKDKLKPRNSRGILASILPDWLTGGSKPAETPKQIFSYNQHGNGINPANQPPLVMANERYPNLMMGMPNNFMKGPPNFLWLLSQSKCPEVQQIFQKYFPNRFPTTPSIPFPNFVSPMYGPINSGQFSSPLNTNNQFSGVVPQNLEPRNPAKGFPPTFTPNIPFPEFVAKNFGPMNFPKSFPPMMTQNIPYPNFGIQPIKSFSPIPNIPFQKMNYPFNPLNIPQPFYPQPFNTPPPFAPQFINQQFNPRQSNMSPFNPQMIYIQPPYNPKNLPKKPVDFSRRSMDSNNIPQTPNSLPAGSQYQPPVDYPQPYGSYNFWQDPKPSVMDLVSQYDPMMAAKMFRSFPDMNTMKDDCDGGSKSGFKGEQSKVHYRISDDNHNAEVSPIDVPDDWNNSDRRRSGVEYLNDEKCGLVLNDDGDVVSDRIFGGGNVTLGLFPWVARIGYRNKNNTVSFRCGGALITPTHVVTAAHCVAFSVEVISVVRLGEHDDRTDIDCVENACADPVQDIEPWKIFFHLKYKKNDIANDIAMIVLQKPAEITKWVSTICIPFDYEEFEKVGLEVAAAGWGYYNEKSKPSSVLRAVNLPIIDLDTCKNEFKNSGTIDDHQLCIGGIEGEDSCNGDSGGPLMRVKEGNVPRWQLIGLVSFGANECGSQNVPAVYTKVSAFQSWITYMIGYMNPPTQ